MLDNYNDSGSESNIVQALTEDPGRDEESDADHLERMTDYKSYSKVIFTIKIMLQDQTLIIFKMEIKFGCPGFDGHRPSDGKCKPTATHNGDL